MATVTWDTFPEDKAQSTPRDDPAVIHFARPPIESYTESRTVGYVIDPEAQDLKKTRAKYERRGPEAFTTHEEFTKELFD